MEVIFCHKDGISLVMIYDSLFLGGQVAQIHRIINCFDYKFIHGGVINEF
jgi:hypothetical protein